MCSLTQSIEEATDELQRDGEHDGNDAGHESPENNGSPSQFPRCTQTLGSCGFTMQGSVQLLHGDGHRTPCRWKTQLIHAP